MPSHHRGRPLKAWRYVGFYGPEIMLCIGAVRVGRFRQSFWAVWDRQAGHLHERTRLGRTEVQLAPGHAAVRSGQLRVELGLDERPGIETISPSGQGYAWTRKQGGIEARGYLFIAGATRRLQGRALIDDTAGYHERHTCWRWCAGIGHGLDGRELAWNLVEGVHDAPQCSERTVWVDGEPREVEASPFAPDLTSVGALRFGAEAVRERRENLLLVRSAYRQPFGTFSGVLPGGAELAEGYGVMEAHDAWW